MNHKGQRYKDALSKTTDKHSLNTANLSISVQTVTQVKSTRHPKGVYPSTYVVYVYTTVYAHQ